MHVHDLTKTCLRKEVLDKWFPLKGGYNNNNNNNNNNSNSINNNNNNDNS